LALIAFSRKADLRRIFPAMLVFLGVRVVSDVFLNILLHAHLPIAGKTTYLLYFSVYWLSFLVGSISIFYVVRQTFEAATHPLTGLKKPGRILFRWIGFISLIIVIASSIHPYGWSLRSIPLAMIELMRCMSMLELCLLAFLAFTVHPLGLSFRSHVFGIGLGLGLLAATDMLVAAATHLGNSLATYVSLFGEIGTLTVFMTWCVYFFLPEPARKSMMMQANSQLLRWNEIASAFGHRSGQVVLTPAPSSFFLQDVEKVVDRVMSRNSIDA
jgi:general stress protein CsbA